MRRGDVCRHPRRLRRADEREPVDRQRVEDRDQVLGLLIHGGRVVHRVGGAGAAPVVQRQPRERRRPPEKARPARVLP
jgi:hypothetical protein